MPQSVWLAAISGVPLHMPEAMVTPVAWFTLVSYSMSCPDPDQGFFH